MVALADIAHITPPKGVTLGSDSITERSWLIWQAFLNDAKSQPTSTTNEHGQVVAYGSLKRFALRLFPMSINWSEPDEVRTFMEPVYKYLRQTGNAVVFRKWIGGDPKTSEWHLSPTWLDNKVSRAPSSTLSPTRTEARLTAREAGEDRDPAPVTVIQARPRGVPAKSSRSGVKYDPTATIRLGSMGEYVCTSAGCGRTGTRSQVSGHVRWHRMTKPNGAGFPRGTKLGPRKGSPVAAEQTVIVDQTPDVPVAPPAAPAVSADPAAALQAVLVEYGSMKTTLESIREAVTTLPVGQALGHIIGVLDISLTD